MCQSLGPERAFVQGKGWKHYFVFLFVEFDGFLLISDFFV